MNSSDMVQRLKRIDRLSILGDEILADLARVIIPERHPPGTVICRQGEVESKFYAIEWGEVLIKIETKEQEMSVGRLAEGDVFGEQALTVDRPRSATIIAETIVDLLSLSRSDYQRLSRKHPQLKRIMGGPDIPPLLKGVPLFSKLSDDELADLAERMGTLVFPPAKKVVEQGDRGTAMYVVSEGELVAYRKNEMGQNRPVKALNQGDAFGETSLLVSEPRDATVIAKTYVELCYINRASFERFKDEHPGIEDKLQARPEVERKLQVESFPGQQPDEIVESKENKHWIAFARAVGKPAFMLMLAAMILGAMNFIGGGLAAEAMSQDWFSTALTILWIIWVLASAGVFIWHWIDWHNDFHIITTKRLIHIENELLRSTSRDEIPIRQVQNVDIERNLLGQILGYGHMRVTTAAGGDGTLNIEFVRHPQKFKDAIFKQVSRAKYREVAAERSELERVIRGAIGVTVLDKKIEEQAPPAPMEALGWSALLTQNWLVKQLHKILRGLFDFLRHPHLPRQEIVKDDRIIWRKHRILLLKVAFRPLVLCLLILSLILGAMAGGAGWINWSGLSPSLFGKALLALSLIAILALGWLLWEVEDWRNDQYIITKTHIIDIERVTPILLKETSRQASLDDIQNTNFSIEGFWNRVFKLGDVTIETAGEGTFTFTQVRAPNKVQEEIDKRREAYENKLRQEEAERRRTEMARWFGVYYGTSDDIETRIKRARRLYPTDWLKG